MNNALLYIGGFFVVVLTALFAVPLFIDWNGYRGVFEEEASKVLGRDVRVGGEVNVRFLPTPYVRFEKVRLADPTGHTGEPFVRAESFTMWLSGPALLRGVLEANQVELNKPILSLALDGQGSGNWASLQLKPAELPFVPQDVMLKSVKLQDGVLALYGPNATAIGRISEINGELAADALDGPFKFKGTVLWGGEYREIKLASDKQDADGSVRLKANARSLKAVNSYTLDGRIEKLSSTPKFTGELTAKLPSPGEEAAPDAKAGAEAHGVEFKSNVTADVASATFDDIALSFINVAEPQIVTGKATSTWSGEPRLDVTLASKWLDLDRIAAPGQETATFPSLKKLALGALRSLTGDGAAAIRLDVEQIKMGGETAGGLKLDAERSGADVRVRRLSAGLPGGSRLSVNGEVKDDAGKLTFRGAGSIHGSNVARLIAWAAKSGTAIDFSGEGPFSADGQIVISDTRFELKDAAAEFNGRPVTGEVALIEDAGHRIVVSLEAAKIDTAQFFPKASAEVEKQIRQLFGLEAQSPSSAGAASANGATAEGMKSDVEVRLLTGELKHGNQVYNNVDARLALVGGNINITRADFTTPAGLKVGIEGQVAKAEAAGRGTIAYELQAKTAAAAQDAANVVGLSNIIAPARLASFGPGQVAGLVHIGKRSASAADVTVEGTLNGAAVSGQAIFDNGFGTWRSSPSSTTFKIKAQDPGIITQLAGLPLKPAEGAEPRPAEVVLASSGPLSSGAAALVVIASPGLDASFNGRAYWPEGGSMSFAGPLNVKAQDVQEVMALIGTKLPGGIAGTPVEGLIDIAGEDSTWKLSSKQLVLGNSTLSGTLSVKTAAGAATTIGGDIASDRVTVTALLGALAEKAAAGAANAEAAPADVAAGSVAAAQQAVWPESVFNFTPLKSINGSVAVRFGVFDISGALSVHDGAMTIALAPDSAAMSSLTGRTAGGRIEGAAKLTAETGGVGLDAKFKIADADLAALGSKSSGRATLEFAAGGKGQSPAGIIATMTGTGSVDLKDAVFAGPAPQTVSAAANQVIEAKTSGDPEAIQTGITMALQTSLAAFGSRTVKFTVADGTAKVEPVSIENSEGRAQATVTADLMAMRLDSQWQVTGNVKPLPPAVDVGQDYVPPPPKGPLPPAQIVYTGRLDDLKTLTAAVDTNELQRELTVRQMERNVEELERLRKRDEELARREVERRKAVEAQRAAAAAAAAAAKAKALEAQRATAPGPGSDAQQLPPVLPQSNGTAPPTGNQPAGADAPQAAGPAAGTRGTVTVVPLTVEPIPPSEVTPPQAPGPVPATAEVAPRQVAPPPRPRPAAPRPAAPRRTSGDEVLRSLGGIP